MQQLCHFPWNRRLSSLVLSSPDNGCDIILPVSSTGKNLHHCPSDDGNQLQRSVLFCSDLCTLRTGNIVSESHSDAQYLTPCQGRVKGRGAQKRYPRLHNIWHTALLHVLHPQTHCEPVVDYGLKWFPTSLRIFLTMYRRFLNPVLRCFEAILYLKAIPVHAGLLPPSWVTSSAVLPRFFRGSSCGFAPSSDLIFHFRFEDRLVTTCDPFASVL